VPTPSGRCARCSRSPAVSSTCVASTPTKSPNPNPSGHGNMIITIATLRAAGLTETQILRVVEFADNEQVAKTREKNRIASRNYRARHRNHHDADDSDDAHILTSPPKLRTSKKVGKVSIAADWKLTDADRDYARKKGWPDERIEREAERFFIHYRANSKPWANWHLVWCKWVISEFQNGGQNGTNRRAGKKTHSISATFDDIFEKLQGGDGASVVPFQANPRLLSDRRS